MSSPHPPSQPLLAVLWMMGALASFTSMAVAARELTQDLSVFQISFMRTVICLALLTPYAYKLGWQKMKTDRLKTHVGRNIIHFTGQFGWIYGVSILPLAAVFSLEFSAPIWTAILAALLLKERITRIRALSIALGFAGILVILRPGSDLMQPASFVVIGAAICFAFTYVFTRGLAATESAFKIIFYMNLIQFPIGLVLSVPVWITPGTEMLPFIAILGIGGITSHYSIARAMAHADAAVVSPLDFLRLPLVAVIGFLLYQEPWNPYVIIGGAITFSGNLLNILSEQKALKRRMRPEPTPPQT
ncbi:DMT family transporter [Nisaea acidiphila]|uniref:DMT family transporter n=1 Tax=Nisaea acidiphila TaxID=1862145 RepID=A0A9J7AWD1_9PROT|nr:DMT family transporter [Nisaea acidiphila]UUX50572.1 DMT family transporter [Nisaea acidiphila]